MSNNESNKEQVMPVGKIADHAVPKSLELRNSNGDVLQLRFRDGRPRYLLEYKHPEGTDLKKLKYKDRQLVAPFNSKEFYAFLDISYAIFIDNAQTLKDTEVISLYDYDIDGNKLKEKVAKATCKFYKNEAEVWCIKITNNLLDNKETIFEFKPEEWHEFKLNGVRMSDAMFTSFFTKRYFTRMFAILDYLDNLNVIRYKTEQISIPIDATKSPEVKDEVKVTKF